jgi:hypothetical protein
MNASLRHSLDHLIVRDEAHDKDIADGLGLPEGVRMAVMHKVKHAIHVYSHRLFLSSGTGRGRRGRCDVAAIGGASLRPIDSGGAEERG